VAAQYFEEILLDLKKHNQKISESVHKALNVVMCYVVECEYLAGVNVNVFWGC